MNWASRTSMIRIRNRLLVKTAFTVSLMVGRSNLDHGKLPQSFIMIYSFYLTMKINNVNRKRK